MSDERTGSGPDDPRLADALEEYLIALEAGRRPDRAAFLARHPDLADALAECLDGVDALHGGGAPTIPAPAETPGMPLGDFRIVREIGRGGMGVVYEAEQLSLGRRVALKVLPFAAGLDARHLQRFKNEAQAAAHLHHPHIVPVFAVGSERGVHYYAMQLIEGQNLAATIDGLRDEAGRHDDRTVTASRPVGMPSAAPTTPAARLSTKRSVRGVDFFRTAARMVAQAADALDYAHSVGVVHRDVKPANLLVDSRGDVWVTDFGLAQFQRDAGLTQTGDLLGTLRYMSPEQAGGQRAVTDHRTDVYSLGATLYELLTLRPVFDAGDRQTLLRQILHEDPRPPRTIEPAVPPELETVALKALAKNPADRYATAREFADDLRRFLDGRPVLARRPTLTQRVRQWGRRHPSFVAAGVLLCVLTAVVSLAAAGAVNLERARAAAAYQAERRRAEEAEARFRLARRSVDEMIRFSEEELADKPFLHPLRKRLLTSALAFYQEFIDERRDDPAAQDELRETQGRVKAILADLAVVESAAQFFLLNDASVLADLGVAGEQRARVAELNRRFEKLRSEAFRDLLRLSPEERRQRFAESARSAESAVAGVLTAAQRARLRQVWLQLQGPAALADPEIAAHLGLSAAQRDQARTAADAAFFAAQRRPGELPVDRVREVLTDEQRAKWQEMTGPPFKGATPFRFPGGPGGPPPPPPA